MSQLSSIFRFRHIVLVLLVAAMLAPAALTSSVATAQGYCGSAEVTDMLQRINQYRESNGLQSVTLSAPLGTGAEIKSADMANRNYFAHVSPSGLGPRDVLNTAGYPSNATWGEILAAGDSDVGSTFQQWVNSPTHRNVMLDGRFTAVGIARVDNSSSQFGSYWTGMFGDVVSTPAVTCGGDASVEAPVAPPAASPVDALVGVLIAILARIFAG